ncbi:ATP-binding cassette domain-containing protein, partial [Mesorhizobium sp. M00.F.Ca.ET.186.01.1.1]
MQTFGLTVDQVSKTINDKTIVHPFSLRIEPGEVVALCGGNGAGKSTILRMLVGILRPTTGTIQINGMSWEEQRVDY